MILTNFTKSIILKLNFSTYLFLSYLSKIPKITLKIGLIPIKFNLKSILIIFLPIKLIPKIS